MIKKLITIANNLDERGLVKEADILDKIIKSAFWGKWLDGADDAMEDKEVVFDLYDPHGDGCFTKLTVSRDAKFVEESPSTISYRWNCVSPDDPFNKSNQKYANITLQFFKTGPINKDEIEEALAGRDRSEYSEIVSEIGRYCINEVPNISKFDTRGCD